MQSSIASFLIFEKKAYKEFKTNFSNMCSTYSNGINVIWRMEVFENINKYDSIYAKLNWPLSKIMFRFAVTGNYGCDFSDESDNDDDYYDDDDVTKDGFRLTIKRIDNSDETIALNGTVSVFTLAESIQHLNEFISVKFKHNTTKHLYLESFQNMFPVGNITFLIQLWNSPEKRINANYYASSKLIREKCNFKWELETLNTKNKKINRTYCHEFIQTIPKKFTTYNKIIKRKDITIKLVIESFIEIKKIYRAYINSTSFIKGKLKIVAIRENGNTLNLLDTHFATETNDYYNLDIGELITNRHLFYPQRVLTLKIFTETLSYLNAKITEVDYLSDTQNLSDLFKRSNKFRKDLNAANSSSNLSTSLYALYKENQFCDVTLCVGKEKFLCHKSVLCARSPVFRAMFGNDMLEKKSNTVPIEDMDARCFGIFLNILYTDSLFDVEEEDVFKIYEAADKYDVCEIRKMCSRFLLCNLSTTNACQILELSNAHQDDDLMTKTRKFISKHSKEVMKLPDWNNFMEKNPAFAAKLMHEIITA